MTPTYSEFKLDTVEGLPHVTVTFPGERWSDGRAYESITPGDLIIPINSAGLRYWARAASGAVDPRSAIAMQTVRLPDTNAGSLYGDAVGPNEIVNTVIPQHEYVMAVRSGGFLLTRIAEDTYVPGDLLMWNKTANPQTGKGAAGSGAWVKTATAANAFFEVTGFRTIPGQTSRGILEVTSLRSQF